MNLKGRAYLWVIGFGFCVIAACKPNSADLPAALPATGNVSYFNLIPNSGAINLYLNGSRQNSNKIGYNESSGYIAVTSGEQSISFKTDSLRNILFEPVATTLAADYTTILVTGTAASNLIYARDTAAADNSSAKPKLRFINASANSPAYDVALNNVTISNTAYKGISAFARVDTGKVAVTVKQTGSSVILASKQLTLVSNKVYTYFIYGTYNAAGSGLNLRLIINK